MLFPAVFWRRSSNVIKASGASGVHLSALPSPQPPGAMLCGNAVGARAALGRSALPCRWKTEAHNISQGPCILRDTKCLTTTS